MSKKICATVFLAYYLAVSPVVGVVGASGPPVPPAAPGVPSTPDVVDVPASSEAAEPPEAPSVDEVVGDKPEAPVAPGVPSALEGEASSESDAGGQVVESDGEAGSQSASENLAADNSQTGVESENLAETSEENSTEVYSDNEAEIDSQLVLSSDTGGNDASKNTGDVAITTGDSTVAATIENQANEGVVLLGGCGDCDGGGGVVSGNEGTGGGSENLAEGQVTDESLVVNNNTAELDSGVITLADTGHNTADKNTGDATIETGDTNVGLTVVNLANTDIVGVETTEFNVYDDHRGDIVIDFDEDSGDVVTADNQATGADSENEASSEKDRALTIVNNNDAQVASELVVDATTGRNSADENTGDAAIETGDATVVANVVNLVNTTVAGGAEVLVATVNIFGDLVGDIILAPLAGSDCGDCSSDNLAVGNSQTGAESENLASSNQGESGEIYTTNTAEVDNGVAVVANTGGNEVLENTEGGQVSSGDVQVSVQETTVVNTNVEGGTWWLVIVNEAGRWVGKIFGSEDGQTMASGGSVDLGAANQDTGGGSENLAESSNSSDLSVVTNNSAEVDSQVTVVADTGHNSASKNTGSGTVSTGDVSVSANILNFINNNFVGGKVVVTFVNIFGSWVGDVIPPGVTRSLAEDGVEQLEVGEVGSLGDDAVILSGDVGLGLEEGNFYDGQEEGSAGGAEVVTENVGKGNESGFVGQMAMAMFGGGGDGGSGSKLASGWMVEEDDYLKVAGVEKSFSGSDGASGSVGLRSVGQAWGWGSREIRLMGLLLLGLPVWLAAGISKRRMVETGFRLPGLPARLMGAGS